MVTTDKAKATQVRGLFYLHLSINIHINKAFQQQSMQTFIMSSILPDTLHYAPTVWLSAQSSAARTSGPTVNQIQTFHSSAPLRGLGWPLF